MQRKSRMFCGIWVLWLVSVGVSWGAPHEGEVYWLSQPDGSRVAVRVYGDEYYQRVESGDGYALVREEQSGWICYAEVAADGRAYVSTGIRYTGKPVVEWDDSDEKTEILGLAQHLRLRSEVVRDKVSARRAELEAGAEDTTAAGKAGAEALTGSIVGLTFLIEFPDVAGSINRDEVVDYCNQVGYNGYGNNGSVYDYFYAVSNGMLEYTNIVTHYYMAQHEKSYYDNCDGGRARELLGEALAWLDGLGFNWHQLSLDGSNRIIALNTFYAGGPDCGWAKGLWPHKGWYSGFTSSTGVKTGDYQITNIGSQLRLGTFCHENGHMVCDWPDLYDYGGESRGVGEYCIMASSGSTNPRFPNPYFRDLRGWETVIDITDDPPSTVRTHQANSFTTYRYSHPTNTREFFMVESRLKTGRHSGIPDEGLLIWHIDEDGSNNNEQMTPEQHYRVSVEQADGQFHLERDINGGGSGDLFHAGHNDTFSDYTLPDALWWDGAESGMRITNISAVSANMSFIVDNVSIDLSVGPGARQEMGGLVGGPFGPTTVQYTLRNQSSSSLDWSVSKTAGWLSVPTGGTLGAGGVTPVDVSLTAVVADLPPGTYNDTILFSNMTGGGSLEREVQLIVSPRELIGHWRFEDPSGTTAVDSTGHGHEGTLLGGMSFTSDSVPGPFGQALNFDGVDDTIHFEGFALPRPYFSISFWFNPDNNLSGSSPRTDFLYWDNGDHPHITFNRAGNGEIGLYVEYDTVLYEDIFTTTTSWAAGEWHLVTFTFDGNDYKVYVNGLLENTYNHPGIHIVTTEPYLGSRKGDDNYFDGQIDDVRFYNSAVPGEGVYALWQGGRAVNPLPEDRNSNIRPYTGLQWLPGSEVVEHDVYLGGDYDSVRFATPGSPEYRGRFTDLFFAGVALNDHTHYFWRADGVRSDGVIIPGEVWKYLTGGHGGYEQIYEAEDGLLNGAEISTNHGGYTGTGYVDYINATGAYVVWLKVFAHYDGIHELTFRYALTTGNRPLELRVNGIVTNPNLSFPATGAWTNWSYTEKAPVSLHTGYNVIRVTATGSSGPNLDHMKVIESGAPVNHCPSFITKPITNAAIPEDRDYSGSLGSEVEDPDGGSVTFVKAGGPEWLTIAADGGMSGRPTHADEGENVFSVWVEDPLGGFDKTLLRIPVADMYSGEMGWEDLMGFGQNWLETQCGGVPGCNGADLDNDGGVGIGDFVQVSGNWQEGVVPGLAGWWNMDEGGGTTLRDNYGYWDGTLMQMDDYNWSAGRKGNCLRFDGTDEFVNIDGYKGIGGTASRTVTAWINSRNGPGTIVSWGTETPGGKWMVLLSADGRVTLGVWGGSVTGSTSITDGGWHHVAVVLDSNGTPDVTDVQFYIDGGPEVIAESAPHAIDTGMLENVQIGRFSQDFPEFYFDGFIDGLRIYDRALLSTEIQALYVSGSD